jgi:two-component system, LytTR family, response regulator
MEQKLRALVIDDEERARYLLNKLLEETLFFSEIRMAGSVASANIELTRFNPDLIFLDIRMPGKDGFALISDLQNKNGNPGIVFVTAYEQYAIKAIKNQAFDYLLKPVNRKELKQCVVKFIEKRKDGIHSDKPEKEAELFDKLKRVRVNTRTGTMFINPATILYCKADGNYTIICTGEKHHLCSMNLGKLEELLTGNGFVRLGRSHILNLEFIAMYDRKDCSVTLARNGESVKITIPKQHLKALDLF